MFKWLKNIFGSKPEPIVLTKEQRVETKVEPKVVQAEPVAKPKKQAQKPATKKAAKVNLDGMSKKDLLAEAKKRSIKANASLSKEEILKRIKNG